ncbi:MAG: PorP/SprF family type IX secretion system membrane protein [Bacteroidia bacterium]|nr:PorP/SprF family type IX secretion system membrane protein [Bacteroidia bacterium]
MKTKILVLILCVLAAPEVFSQEDNGVVALGLPVRNSLTFNRYTINPTFSFVREQNKYVSLYNKREFVQFEDAPVTYLASYTGRLAENMGAGVGMFQQNYGILTTFGGMVNFAYNARLDRDSNLTFGLNIGAYNSGINSGRVIANFDDPALQNIPEYFLLTINPGINYGLAFLDFGVSINNLAVYNFQSSQLLKDNLQRGIQAHMMYTGFMESRGFLDQAKFSGIVRSEFRKEETILSGMVMLTVPKGIWAQAGYNSVFGASGGVGVNITEQIAIEYNFEKDLGDLTEFGPSHDITLAYRIKNKQNYYYSSGEEISGLISTDKRTKVKPLSESAKSKAEANKEAVAERRAQAQAKKLADKKAKEAAAAAAVLLAEQKAKEEAEEQARLIEEQKAKEEAEAQARLLEEQKAKEEEAEQARQLAEQTAKEEAEKQTRLLAEQKAKEEAAEQARQLAEQKAKEEAEKQARLLAEQKAKEEAEEQARQLAEQKAKEQAEEKARLLAEEKAMEEAEAAALLLAQQQAEEEAEVQRLAEEQALEERINNPNDELGKDMLALSQKVENAKARQDEFLKKFDEMVEVKDKDLKDLKEENDLSEQGISVEPKPFKSVNRENMILDATIKELESIIESRNKDIEDLMNLYDEKYDEEIGTVYLDEVYVYYKNTLERLTAEQVQATQTKIELQLELEDIQIATEFEKNRRIKRAAFDNEEDRYTNDRETLQNIKLNTPLANQPYTVDDFDFGEDQSGNITILKNVNRVDNGYYLIIAVHNDTDKRNEFLTKVVASGRADVDFFYDENTSKYYIYYEKFDSLITANEAMESKGNRPYNTRMSLVKIED